MCYVCNLLANLRNPKLSDMEVEFDQHTGHRELTKFVLSKSKWNLERLWNWAAGNSKGKGAGGETR